MLLNISQAIPLKKVVQIVQAFQSLSGGVTHFMLQIVFKIKMFLRRIEQTIV